MKMSTLRKQSVFVRIVVTLLYGGKTFFKKPKHHTNERHSTKQIHFASLVFYMQILDKIFTLKFLVFLTTVLVISV